MSYANSYINRTKNAQPKNTLTVGTFKVPRFHRKQGLARALPEVFVDGIRLIDHLGDVECGEFPAFAIPFTRPHVITHLDDRACLRRELKKHLGYEYNAWASVAALLVEPTGFPQAKIPIYMCHCANEYCGYLACTIETFDDIVVFRDFGVLFPNAYSLPDAQLSEEEEFTPLATQPVFVFGRTEYEQAILQILRSTPDQGAPRLENARIWLAKLSTWLRH